MNLLYLIIHPATGDFKEKNGEKYEEVFSGIRSKIKTVNGGKKIS